jgi:hypothetical protein
MEHVCHTNMMTMIVAVGCATEINYAAGGASMQFKGSNILTLEWYRGCNVAKTWFYLQHLGSNIYVIRSLGKFTLAYQHILQS